MRTDSVCCTLGFRLSQNLVGSMVCLKGGPHLPPCGIASYRLVYGRFSGSTFICTLPFKLLLFCLICFNVSEPVVSWSRFQNPGVTTCWFLLSVCGSSSVWRVHGLCWTCTGWAGARWRLQPESTSVIVTGCAFAWVATGPRRAAVVLLGPGLSCVLPCRAAECGQCGRQSQ